MNRICPACGGVRGASGMEKEGEHLCRSESDCIDALLAEAKERRANVLDFHSCRLKLGWSADWLSAYLDVNITTVKRWDNGQLEVEPRVMAWIRDRAARMEELIGYPEGWDT